MRAATLPTWISYKRAEDNLSCQFGSLYQPESRQVIGSAIKQALRDESSKSFPIYSRFEQMSFCNTGYEVQERIGGAGRTTVGIPVVNRSVCFVDHISLLSQLGEVVFVIARFVTQKVDRISKLDQQAPVQLKTLTTARTSSCRSRLRN